MNETQLGPYFKALKENWDAQNQQTVERAVLAIRDLINNPEFKTQLHQDRFGLEKGVELYRDPETGFILLAYSEAKDLYRIPHNHGNGWVIYTVLEGVIEMGTYSLLGKNLVKRDRRQMQKGDMETYFPGDIHDTKCVSESVIILRFTSCDLKEEDKSGRMVRFPKQCSL